MEFNNTNATDQPYDNLTHWEKIAAIFIYSVVSLLAIGGNYCVIHLVFKFQRLKSPTNYLIANLAVADFSMALLCIPFSYWPTIILSYWPFGYMMCKVINYSQCIAVMSSAYTLVAISLDRFVAIMFPLKASWKLTKAKALCSIGAIWLGSGIIASPLLIVLGVTTYEDGSLQCLEHWTPPETESWYSLSLMVIQFAIPFGVFIVTYTGIGLRLWFSSIPGEGNVGVVKERKDSVKKMIPTMMIITLLFAISWIPLNVLNIWYSIVPEFKNYRHILRLWWGCHLIAMSHSFVNPIVYVVRNQRFRDGFGYLFRWITCIHYSGNLHGNNATTSTYASSAVHSDRKTVRLHMTEFRKTMNGNGTVKAHVRLLKSTDSRDHESDRDIDHENESMLCEPVTENHRLSIGSND